jgi:hypothetical protein
MINEGYIPSIQRKINFRGPKSVRKVDLLILVFIDFYVPPLTPRLNSADTWLQLSENITLFAVCHICTGVIKKETYIRVYARCLGAGTGRNLVATRPVRISPGVNISPSTETLNFLRER